MNLNMLAGNYIGLLAASCPYQNKYFEVSELTMKWNEKEWLFLLYFGLSGREQCSARCC